MNINWFEAAVVLTASEAVVYAMVRDQPLSVILVCALVIAPALAWSIPKLLKVFGQALG